MGFQSAIMPRPQGLQPARPQMAIVPRERVVGIVELKAQLEASQGRIRQLEHNLQVVAAERDLARGQAAAWRERGKAFSKTASSVLSEIHDPRQRTAYELAEEITAAIARRAGLDPEVLKSKRRNYAIVTARKEAVVAVAKAIPRWSLPDIARYFDKDHTTIVHHLKAAGVVRDKPPNPLEGLPLGCRRSDQRPRELIDNALARVKAGEQQADVARDLGIPRTTLGNWVRGVRRVGE